MTRLALATAGAIALWSVIDQGGPASFDAPSNATEPITLLLHLSMLFAYVMVVGQVGALMSGPGAVRRYQLLGAGILGVVLTLAALLAVVSTNVVWASPFVELVWLFDVVMLTETILALVIASALGTPGCEVRVWADLAHRAGLARTATQAGELCPVGLHLLDEWEAGRSFRRDRRDS